MPSCMLDVVQSSGENVEDIDYILVGTINPIEATKLNVIRMKYLVVANC